MSERNAGDREPPRHGGDLDHANAAYGTPAGGWLDLSTGINPHAYPVSVIEATALRRLPSGSDLARLLAAARAAYRVPESVAIMATPGSDVAIRLLPFVAPAGPAAIVTPTYRSHAEAWRDAGRKATAVAGLDALPANVTVAVVANPNNPDGRRIHPADLIAAAGPRRLLIVDEAFADLVPDASLVPHLDGRNALVLRSFGKFFGLPGLRLGFVAGARDIAGRLAALVGDWPVSTPALAVGTAALADREWQAATRTRLAEEAQRLRKLLTDHGLVVRGGCDLFVLIEHPDASGWHHRLARRGVWTRAFTEYPTWLRIGLPSDDAGFDRLDRALTAG